MVVMTQNISLCNHSYFHFFLFCIFSNVNESEMWYVEEALCDALQNN